MQYARISCDVDNLCQPDTNNNVTNSVDQEATSFHWKSTFLWRMQYESKSNTDQKGVKLSVSMTKSQTTITGTIFRDLPITSPCQPQNFFEVFLKHMGLLLKPVSRMYQRDVCGSLENCKKKGVPREVTEF